MREPQARKENKKQTKNKQKLTQFFNAKVDSNKSEQTLSRENS